MITSKILNNDRDSMREAYTVHLHSTAPQMPRIDVAGARIIQCNSISTSGVHKDELSVINIATNNLLLADA